MMILSIFNNFQKKYFLVDKNVHTASNGELKPTYMIAHSPGIQIRELNIH